MERRFIDLNGSLSRASRVHLRVGGAGAGGGTVQIGNVLRVTDKERLVKVDWGTEEKTFPIPLQIKAYDRQGLMTDISAIISSEPVRLIDLSLNNRQNLVVINLVLEISGISQLSRLLARLENLPNVIQAIRVRPG